MLFDQHASTWVEQAKQLDRTIDLGFWSGEILPAQVSAVNPMVMILIPIMTFGVFPAIEKRGIKLTPLTELDIVNDVAAGSSARKNRWTSTPGVD